MNEESGQLIQLACNGNDTAFIKLMSTAKINYIELHTLTCRTNRMHSKRFKKRPIVPIKEFANCVSLATDKVIVADIRSIIFQKVYQIAIFADQETVICVK